MSNASEAFSAFDHILDGDWDPYLVRIQAAVKQRMRTEAYRAHIIAGRK